MSALLQFSFDFKTITCCACSCTFAVPLAFYDRRKNDGQNFWCPNGHDQHFTETRVAKLERELELEKKRKQWVEEDLKRARERRDHFERSARAYKGKLTHVKTRIKNGVCPCCKRSFQNLHQHMKNQHPDFGTEK
jgi:predicted  nucleic acid-binding Zn-ribbon protein